MKVLDASALLAVLFDEPGREKVEPELSSSLMSVANATEVLTKLIGSGFRFEEAWEDIGNLGITWVAADLSHSHVAAQLSIHKGLSLGDRFCLALARIKALPVLTADRMWVSYDLDIKIVLIR